MNSKEKKRLKAAVASVDVLTEKAEKVEKTTDGGTAKGTKLVGFAAFKAQVWEYSKAIAVALLLALTIRSFVVQAFHIPSSSMVPTFLEGDRVLVTKFSYGIRNPFTNNILFGTGRPERGDVVIFQYPFDHNTDFVKRVIGLPGDKIQVIRGKIFVNDQPFDDPHGHYDSPYMVNSRDFGPQVVPENSYFMMGDNRDYSNDSRSWGSVDASLLRGKAWRLYWSWNSVDSKLSVFQRLRRDRLGKKIE
ncbi:MAG: signal peptidase I [Deltaproteobacteria bacterium]|nr:signal peptidase I [Deltaproteobacteria bacterium]